MIRRKRGLHTTRAMTQWPCHYGFQVKYWRYLRFLSGNRLQYACTPTVPPSEAGKLIRVCTTQPSLHHDVSAQNLMESLFLWLQDGGNARHKEVCGGHYSVHRGDRKSVV